MDRDRLMIIDGSSLVYRAFYAMPPLNTKSGIYTNAVLGFLNMLNKIRDEYAPTHICVAFDRSARTFRHKEFADYKGTRDKTPNELSQQFPLIKDILRAMGIKIHDMEEFEADDIAGTLAKKGEELGMDVILVTGDKDYLQLATDKSKILITKKGISEMEIYDKNRIIEEYGILPEAFIDMKGLMGDKSDNIPGVPGIGEKTALKLLTEFGTLENIYESIDNVSGGKLKEKLLDNKEMAFLSKRLGEIIVNVPLGFGVEELLLREADTDLLRKKYEELELKSLLSKLPDSIRNHEAHVYKNPDAISTKSELNVIVKKLKEIGSFSFKTLFNGDYLNGDPILFGFSIPGSGAWYIDLRQENAMELFSEFKGVFEDQTVKKISWDVKADICYMLSLGWNPTGIDFDASIAEYIINPSQSNLSINKLSDEYFGIYGPDIDDKLKKSKASLRDLPIKESISYLGFILDTVEKLKLPMKDIISNRNMVQLFDEVEMPLVTVLASMENTGVAVDKGQLLKLGDEYGKEIKELEESIYSLAGRSFNINSPKQLGEILFEELGLPVIKKTKTGYSTDVEVLEALEKEHPMISKILRYRQIVKLNSTYIEGLQPMINERTGRIHSKFNQTVTSTGRISSTEPNLQNIPIRTEDGRRIRKAFIAEKPGFRLLDGDYSQIELRLLAHISDDPKMKEAFLNEEDIHAKTASEVFEIPLEEITPELRYKAKAVNFSIIYGISDFSLSRDLGTTRKEARTYIDNYFENYKLVKEYMDKSVEMGKEKGYVETLLNRRRYIPELESSNFNIRSFGERVAMNMPIQGSAADIIKLAMVKVYDRLKDEGLKSRLILTIHDELIIEAAVDELEYVKDMMKEIMENAIDLRVPLKVDVMEGDSWYDTK